MYKIAVMGDLDSVLGFKALGLDVCPMSTPWRAAPPSTAWPRKTTPSSI